MTRIEISQIKFDRFTIVRNIATLFTGTVITQGLTALLLILTARQLGPEYYGQYTSTMTLATLLSIFFNLGFNLWLLREGGQSPSKIGEIIGSIFAVKLFSGIIWLILIALIAQYIHLSALPSKLFLLAAVTILISSLYTTILTSFKAILRNEYNSSLEALSVIGQLFVVLILIYQGDQDVNHYVSSRAGVLFVFLLISIAMAFALLHPRYNLSTVRRAIYQSPPYAASELLAWMFMRVDLLIIAIRLDEYSVGIYSAAEGVLNTLFFVPGIVSFVIIPVLSNLFSTDVRQAWLTAGRSLILHVFIGAGMFLAIFFGAPILVFIFGPAYADTSKVMQILSVIILFHSLSYGVSSILVATNQQTSRSLVQFIAVIINIVLNLLVVKRAGINGVAIVYIITEVVLLAGYSWLVIKYRLRTTPNISTIGTGPA